MIVVAEITQTERKAFEKFLQSLAVDKVSSVDECEEKIEEFKKVAKHVGKDFNKMMKETALWMKQCVPGGNKKWSVGNDEFPQKDGFDILYKYAPKEIVSILESGGQPLLDIFSNKYAKNTHATLKTITLGDYEDLVKKVDPSEIINVYEENGYVRLNDESEDDFISRSIINDHKYASDNSCLLFNVDSLMSADEYKPSSNNFTLYVCYNDKDFGEVESAIEYMNETSIKAITETLLNNNGVNSKVEFIGGQEKIDDNSFDVKFKLLTPPAVGEEFGFVCISLPKKEMYKDVFKVEEVSTIADAMSLKQKLEFMFSESFKELKVELKDFNDVVTVECIDSNGFNCKIQVYKDGDIDVLYTDFSIELKNDITYKIKEILGQKDWTSANSKSTTHVLDSFDLYPNDKDLDVVCRFLEITREDGSKFWGIDAVDYRVKDNKNLGHTKTTYRDYNDVSRYFRNLKEKAEKSKISEGNKKYDKVDKIGPYREDSYFKNHDGSPVKIRPYKKLSDIEQKDKDIQAKKDKANDDIFKSESAVRAEISKKDNLYFPQSAKSYGLNESDIVGWFSNSHNSFGWVLFSTNESEKSEFGSDVLRSYSDGTNSTSIIKINPSSGTYAFIDNKAYEDGEIKYEKFLPYRKLVVRNTPEAIKLFGM